VNDSPMMTKAEAAKWCRVSIAAFDAHVRPQLPCKQIGRRVVFHRDDLEAWAQADATRPAPRVSKGAPSLRPQTFAGSPLLQRLLVSPEVKARADEMRATIARRAEKRRIREGIESKEKQNA
jgi:hypothetical protein